ncbi:MAG: DUF2254 domain-containing protein [Deltaproteobacteria bacterium]|nr:DUF2254 domain-containing protein [Deltaproteobacteria bacterium]
MPAKEGTTVREPAGRGRGPGGVDGLLARPTSEKRRFWLLPVMALTGITAVLFLVGYVIDFRLAGTTRHGLLGTLFRYDLPTCQNAIANLAQVVAAVLGIAITVVSIIVQLAATRYTPRVAEMFFRDRTNLAILTFFVVAGAHSLWVSMAVTGEVLPRVSITITMFFLTGSLMLLVPYFVYVFDFMDPERVIARIQEQALAAARGQEGPRDVDTRQGRVLAAIEQLADVGVNAISQKDRGIAAGTVNALMELAVRYLPEKARLEKEWFALGHRLRGNPDFVAMTEGSLQDLAASRAWLEFKVMRQFQTIFGESVSEMRDVARVVAINTRYIGEAALRADDREALALAIKFFNTYLRVTVNASEVRTAYNVLNQYRLLVDAVLRAGREEVALQFARHLSYYGQLAQSRDLGFVTETAAYDLCALCEAAYEVKAQNQTAMLRIFLDVDRESESAEQEITLRGVRKAQVKLATFYLVNEATDLARTIHADMADEKPDRLASIREELLSITTKDFWEVIDRGSNFDYLEPDRKAQLHTFFSWFPQLQGTTPTVPPV